MMMVLQGLKAETVLGVYAKERETPRPVILNLMIEYDHKLGAGSDNINHVPDYERIEGAIVKSVAQQSFALIEALIMHVAEIVLQFPLVREVTVEVAKPGALAHTDLVSIRHTVTR